MKACEGGGSGWCGLEGETVSKTRERCGELREKVDQSGRGRPECAWDQRLRSRFCGVSAISDRCLERL